MLRKQNEGVRKGERRERLGRVNERDEVIEIGVRYHEKDKHGKNGREGKALTVLKHNCAS